MVSAVISPRAAGLLKKLAGSSVSIDCLHDTHSTCPQPRRAVTRPHPTLAHLRSLIEMTVFEEGPDADEIDLAGGVKSQFARPAGFH
jgi:hypothetical protein